VELRVAAALSGDTNLRAILAEGRDLHAEIAREVFGPEASKEDRSVAKRIVFGRLYGGGIRTLAEQAGVSESVAASAVDVLDDMTPGLATWSRHLREAVKAGATEFPTYSGRVIHLDPAYPHKAPHYAIQGTARELLVDALLRWDATKWGGSVVLPVHDEIIAMVPEQEGREATAALLECMTTEIEGVTIAAEASAPSVVWAEERCSPDFATSPPRFVHRGGSDVHYLRNHRLRPARRRRSRQNRRPVYDCPARLPQAYHSVRRLAHARHRPRRSQGAAPGASEADRHPIPAQRARRAVLRGRSGVSHRHHRRSDQRLTTGEAPITATCAIANCGRPVADAHVCTGCADRTAAR